MVVWVINYGLEWICGGEKNSRAILRDHIVFRLAGLGTTTYNYGDKCRYIIERSYVYMYVIRPPDKWLQVIRRAL